MLFLELPIPIYWFVVHAFARRSHVRSTAVCLAGLVVSWPPAGAGLVFFRHELFRAEPPGTVAIATALGLVSTEVWIFSRTLRDLGTGRLVGRAELRQNGELAQHGIYSRIRHPRYAGSFLAILGACLLARTRVAWIIGAVWIALMLRAILTEERELRRRFGASYEDYCRRVPRFIPFERRN